MAPKKASPHKPHKKSSGSKHGAKHAEAPEPSWEPQPPAPEGAPEFTPTSAAGAEPSLATPEPTPSFTPEASESSETVTVAPPEAAAQEMGAPVSPAAPTAPGLPAVAALGWVLFVVGLFLPSYFYSWSLENGVDYALYGLNGTYLAVALSLVGLIVGIVFNFVPRRAAPWVASPTPAWVSERVDQLNARARVLRVFSIAGLALAAIGLLLAAWVSLLRLQAGSPAAAVDLLGTPVVASEWINMGYGLGALGLVLWLVTFFQVPATKEAALAASAVAPAGVGSSAPGLVGGVNQAQLDALMRRMDGLLATLPDDVVTEFSKSPEADTYLRILGGKGPPS